MTRYIDADALKELWQPDHNRKFDADYFIHTIDNAPTADVVEVVRCKNCRSGCPEIMNDNGMVEVHYYCDDDGFYHSGDYYCADGEWGE